MSELQRRLREQRDHADDWRTDLCEKAADALDAQAAEIAALRARLAEAERAIAAHNDSCASACGIGDQEGVRCGYRDYFPRHCPECPRGWMIDAARGGA